MKNVEDNKSFKKVLEKSENIVENKPRVNSILEKATKKLVKVKDKTKEFKDNLGVVIYLVKDWLTGNYTEIPNKTIIYILGAILYFLMPIDMIPDFIFKFGLLDDVAVLNFVLSSFVEDIEKYKEYRELKKQNEEKSEETKK